jgi:hypothetical protein
MARHFRGAGNLDFRCYVHELSRLHKPDIFVIVENHIAIPPLLSYMEG